MGEGGGSLNEQTKNIFLHLLGDSDDLKESSKELSCTCNFDLWNLNSLTFFWTDVSQNGMLRHTFGTLVGRNIF